MGKSLPNFLVDEAGSVTMHWSRHHFYNLSIETSGTKLIWPYLLVEWARSNSCILHITTNIPLVTNWDRIRFPFPFTIHHSHTVRSGEPSTLEPTPHRKQSLLLGFPRMARIAPLRRDRGARAAAGAFTTAAQGQQDKRVQPPGEGDWRRGVAVERNPIR